MNWWDALPEPVYGIKPAGIVTRWYQDEANRANVRCLTEGNSALMVKATGLGKTFTAAVMVRDWPGSVLWLTHRDELIRQSRDALERVTGERVDIEQGHERARADTRIVIGSLDTVRRQNRLDRFGKDRFSLVICDEAHIACAATYRKCIEFFNAKRFGMTATADRLDGRSLGALYETVSYKMDILEGIQAGYLVPVEAGIVNVKTLDISGVSMSAGDLAVGQLDEAMLKAAAGIVTGILEHGGDRTGIVYTPGVKSAELIHQLLLGQKRTAVFVSGKTPEEERRESVRKFKSGEAQYFVNCLVAVAGLDAPNCSLVAMARPTKSRLLHTQCCGRATRPLPGVVDQFLDKEAAPQRRMAIASSSKPNALILDFVGNCGKHSLVSSVDLMAGKFTEAELKTAKKKIVDLGGGDIRKALEDARAELRRIAHAAEIAAKTALTQVDPFGVFHVQVDEALGMRQPATIGQVKFLCWMGLTEKEAQAMSKREANKMIQTAQVRRNKGLADYRQLKELRQFGVDRVAISGQRAETVLRYLRASKKAGNTPDQGTIRELLAS